MRASQPYRSAALAPLAVACGGAGGFCDCARAGRRPARRRTPARGNGKGRCARGRDAHTRERGPRAGSWTAPPITARAAPGTRCAGRCRASGTARSWPIGGARRDRAPAGRPRPCSAPGFCAAVSTTPLPSRAVADASPGADAPAAASVGLAPCLNGPATLSTPTTARNPAAMATGPCQRARERAGASDATGGRCGASTTGSVARRARRATRKASSAAGRAARSSLRSTSPISW